MKTNQLLTDEASQDIRTQADESVRELRAQGWQGGGEDYNLEAFPGDVEALEARMLRPATQEERNAFEEHVSALLDSDDGYAS